MQDNEVQVMNDNDELQHWGIKGMRWGHRRYQNKDGSLTPAGRERYDDYDDDDREAYYEERKRAEKKERRKKLLIAGAAAAATVIAVIGVKKYMDSKNSVGAQNGENAVKALLEKRKAEKSQREQQARSKLAEMADRKRFEEEIKNMRKESARLDTEAWNNRNLDFKNIGEFETIRKSWNKQHGINLPQDPRYKDYMRAQKANARNEAKSKRIADAYERNRANAANALAKELLKNIRRSK